MKTIIKICFTVFLATLPNWMYAQEITTELKEKSWLSQMAATEDGQLLLVIGGMLILLIFFLIVMVVLLARTADIIFAKKTKEPVSWTKKLKQRWITGKLKPVGQDGDMLLDHNYDGIQEMNYGMPPWLRYIFIGTFLFAVFYVPAFLIYDIIPDQKTELAQEIQQAALVAEARVKAGFMSITAETAEFSNDLAAMASGNVLFQKSCAVCHAKDGGGGVGPNLTDSYWLHGSDIKGVFQTISEGVPSKGMIPWKGQLNPKEIQDVANYIISLEGTVAANPKEEQGELRKRNKEEELIEEPAENTDN
ncbi:MAG: cytochrome c oxidase cbb3-type subunit 3 [Marivirga sp.]|jgi:cytochrome c oxidase cbb3-type subunit 3